jgi:regulator of protease activity HflC (stomatin/prohibitin superfamily)/RNA polymerase subunit RPABC4/transcription elongation factor Spt4
MLPISADKVEWNEEELAKRLELGKIPHFLVREYERAVFIRDGKVFEEFGPGRHVTSKLPALTNTQMVYVSLLPVKLKWGLPETMSQDNVAVGASGTVELQIDNPKMFWAQVMGSKEAYTESDLRDHILTNLQGVVRTELANLTIHQIYLERDVLIAAMRARLQEMFEAIGIDYKRLEIVGINIPDDVKKALESKKIHDIELSKKKGEAELEVEKARELAKSGIDATAMKELEIAEDSPEILAKKYESQAYKDALQTSRTQDVNLEVETKTQSVGATQPQTGDNCPSCQKAVSPDFKLCPFCGHDLNSNNCRKCGKGLQADFAICPFCGEKV